MMVLGELRKSKLPCNGLTRLRTINLRANGFFISRIHPLLTVPQFDVYMLTHKFYFFFVLATNGGDCVVEPHAAINPLGLKKTSVMNELIQMDRYTQRAHNKSLTFSAAKSERISFSKQSTISSSESTLNRVRRDRSMVIRAERLTDKDGKQTDIVNMDCKRNTAKCVTIVCNIYDVQPKAQVLINVTARLWNSTLVSDYPKVDLVKIASVARIKVYEVQQVHHSDSVTVSKLM